MGNFASSVGTTQPFISVVPSTQIGQYAGVPMIFPVLSDGVGDGPTSTSLLSAVLRERGNISLDGTGIYTGGPNGQSFRVATEPQGVYRVWTVGASASLSHARTVVLRTGLSVTLAADSNAVTATSGAPTGGNAGDLAIDYAGNAYYLNVAGSWVSQGVVYPAGTGTSGPPTDIAFATALPFMGVASMIEHQVAGPIAFTAAASPVDGATIKVPLIPNGTDVPTVPAGWVAFPGSQTYLQGTYNILYAEYVASGGGTIFYGWLNGATLSAAPAQVTAPSLSAAIVGTSVTATDGTVSGSPTPTRTGFQWQSSPPAPATQNFTPIAGATSAAYTPVSGDGLNLLRRADTYSNGIGSPLTIYSNSVTVAVPALLKMNSLQSGVTAAGPSGNGVTVTSQVGSTDFAGGTLKMPSGVACSLTWQVVQLGNTSGAHEVKIIADPVDNTTYNGGGASQSNCLIDLDNDPSSGYYGYEASDGYGGYGAAQGAIAANDQGRFVVTIVDSTHSQIAAQVSKDGGVTWSTIHAITYLNATLYIKGFIRSQIGATEVDFISQSNMVPTP